MWEEVEREKNRQREKDRDVQRQREDGRSSKSKSRQGRFHNTNMHKQPTGFTAQPFEFPERVQIMTWVFPESYQNVRSFATSWLGKHLILQSRRCKGGRVEGINHWVAVIDENTPMFKEDITRVWVQRDFGCHYPLTTVNARLPPTACITSVVVSVNQSKCWIPKW